MVRTDVPDRLDRPAAVERGLRSNRVAGHDRSAVPLHNGSQRCNGNVRDPRQEETTMTTALLRALRLSWRFLMADGRDMSYLNQARHRAL